MRKFSLVLLLILLGFSVYWWSAPSANLQAPTKEKAPSSKTTPLPRLSTKEARQLSELGFDDTAGRLRVSGTVIDEGGAPVADADVGISSNPPRKTKTDASGIFVFEQLAGRPYRFIANKDDLWGEIVATVSSNTPDITLQIKKSAVVEVVVLDATNRAPIANAEVSWGAPLLRSVFTSSDGRASLVGIAESSFFSVSASGYSQGNGEAKPSAAPITILLSPGAPASGVVLSPDGTPVAGAVVFGRDEFISSQRVTSDAQGRWSIPAISAGTFRFVALHQEHAAGYSERITTDGKTAREGITITLAPGAVLSGKVVFAGGAPASGALVDVYPKDRSQVKTERRVSSTNETGEFTIRGLSMSEHWVGASLSDGLSAESVMVDLSGGQGNVVLTLEQASSISGIVLTEKREPVAGAMVMCLPVDMSAALNKARANPQQAANVTNAEGRFELIGLPDDAECALSVFAKGLSAGTPFEEKPWRMAKAGDQGIEIIMKALASVKGKVQFEDGSIPESFTANANFGRPFEFSNQDGSFTLSDVEPGAVRLTLKSDAFQKKEVEGLSVQSGELFDAGVIIVTTGKVVKGKVTANGKPVAGAVVMIDGGISVSGSVLLNKEDPRYKFEGSAAPYTTTKEDGSFLLAGLSGEYDLMAIAEHPEYGRSDPMMIESTSKFIELKLLTTGNLTGTITYAGKPVSCILLAIAESSNLFIQGACDKDGTYKIERLTPGEYKIEAEQRSVGFGVSPPQTYVTAKIKAGETITLDVDIPAGVEVIVNPTQKGATLDGVRIELISGTIKAKTVDELLEITLSLEPNLMRSESIMAFGTGGQAKPFSFEGVAPGSYTVCLTPPRAPGAGISWEEHQKMPVYCHPLTVSDSPLSQTVTYEIP
jgi:hypothetical protein